MGLPGRESVSEASSPSGRTYLFRQGSAPVCEDAADANDDERLQLADAIVVLAHLFGNQGPLPPPFPECGSDPPSEEDALGCSEFSPCTTEDGEAHHR